MRALRGLAAALCCLCLWAQDRQGEALLDYMHAKLSASFARADEAGNQEFLVLAVPGIPLQPDELETPDYISGLVDQVPGPGRNYTPSGRRYSVIYEEILDQVAASRLQVAADADLALKAKRMLFDRSRLGKPSREYLAYLKYAAEYATAQDARAIALAESRTSSKPVSPDLEQAVAAARKNLVNHGYRQRILKAQADLLQGYESNAKVMFENLRRQFRSARRHTGGDGQPWMPVLASPPMDQWLSGNGWHPWAFHQSDCGPGSRPEVDWSPAMTLTVQIKRVKVERPWLDTVIFSTHNWRLQDSARYRLVSSGDPEDPDPGPMPALVTGILLARQLSLTGYAPGPTGRRQAAPPAHLGPFALKGSKSRPPRGDGGTAIQVEDPQIIALICRVVPKSPTPDPRLFR